MPRHDSLQVTWLPIGKIRPYSGNPRTITDDAIRKVASSISTFGWRQPIVVDEDHVIVAGHTRYAAAKRLNLKKVPVHVATGLTDEEARAYRLADNRTAEETSWDPDALKLELAELQGGGFDLSLAGFDGDELKVEAGEAPPEFEPVRADEVKRLDERASIKCPHCGGEFVPS